MSRTAWFFCPDSDKPSGGVRVIYRCVDHLLATGITAAVVHEAPGFRCSWFEHTTPVTPRDDLVVGPTDVFVVPEILAQSVARRYPDVPKVLFIQGTYLTFHHSVLPPAQNDTELPSSVVAVIAVSEDGVDYLRLAFEDACIERLHVGIDHDLYHPPDHEKEQAIAFMPRRRTEDVIQVLRILERRGALEGWRLYPIDAMSGASAASVLRRSALFLSFGYQEGCPLPPLEAMSAGCVVIGYSGNGGREYMLPDVSFLVAEGAIADYVRMVEEVAARWNGGDRFGELTARGGQFVRAEYTVQRERSDIVRIISTVLDREKTGALASPTTSITDA